jgi:hypothetical protein
MNISREDQKQFAREILSISERDTSLETIRSLKALVSLLISWVGEDKDVAIDLSEYIGELLQVVSGGEDTGWKDEFKKTLLEDLEE